MDNAIDWDAAAVKAAFSPNAEPKAPAVLEEYSTIREAATQKFLAAAAHKQDPGPALRGLTLEDCLRAYLAAGHIDFTMQVTLTVTGHADVTIFSTSYESPSLEFELIHSTLYPLDRDLAPGYQRRSYRPVMLDEETFEGFMRAVMLNVDKDFALVVGLEPIAGVDVTLAVDGDDAGPVIATMNIRGNHVEIHKVEPDDAMPAESP